MSGFSPNSCNAASKGVISLGGIHPYIEQIKTQKNLARGKIESRIVDFVYKFASDKGAAIAGASQTIRRITGTGSNTLLHWALRIGSTYFEMSRRPGTDQVVFLSREWDASRTAQIAYEVGDFATTYMTDEQIVDIAYANNCQKYLLAVCRDCLEESHTELLKQWAAFTVLSAGLVKYGTIPTRAYFARQGCPEELLLERDEATLNQLLALTVLLAQRNSTRSQSTVLTKVFDQGTHLWRALFISLVEEIVFSGHEYHASLALMPYVKKPQGPGSVNFAIDNVANSNMKGANRAILALLILLRIPLASTSLVLGTFVQTALEPRSIKNIWARGRVAKRLEVKKDRSKALAADGSRQQPEIQGFWKTNLSTIWQGFRALWKAEKSWQDVAQELDDIVDAFDKMQSSVAQSIQQQTAK